MILTLFFDFQFIFNTIKQQNEINLRHSNKMVQKLSSTIKNINLKVERLQCIIADGIMKILRLLLTSLRNNIIKNLLYIYLCVPQVKQAESNNS